VKLYEVARALTLLSLIVLLGGCMSAKMQVSDKWDPSVKPSYVDYTDYYLAGLIGGGEFNLQKICVDQKPYGFQRYLSAEDIVIRVFTLTIYSPATLRVWCGN
jgi:hypothetical protein